MIDSVVEATLMASYSVKDNRTIGDVLTHMVTEVGELAQEIQIEQGMSYKAAGADGVAGEAIDVMLCALDIIALSQPTWSERDILYYANAKLDKWIKSVNKVGA